jgi:outer membrane protein assembly factor BamB
MTTNELTPSRPIRLWPGVAIAVVGLILRFGAPLFGDDAALIGMFGALAAGLLIVLWWLFFSRAPWRERLGALALMIVATFAVRYAVHPSIRGGMMGIMPVALTIQLLPLALVAAVAITRRSGAGTRLATIGLAILLACGWLTLLRTDGLMGGHPQYAWRWTPTAEERLLAQARVEPAAPAPVPVPAAAPTSAPAPAPAAVEKSAAPAEATVAPAAPATNKNTGAPAATKTHDEAAAPSAPAPAAAKMDVRWPGFRGAARDGIVHGVRIETDWAKSPPVELWRRPIGPGWSSFAVAGDVLYTQEQRGEDELVAAYSLTSGTPVWMHKDAVRFYESNGGAGPRGTPTISGGRLYALGATGILNALDPRTGKTIWTRNAVSDAGISVPGWGISASPVIVDDVVIVAVSGALAGYDAATGAPRWKRKSGGGSYSSPHLVNIAGVPQILLMGGAGVVSVAPADGRLLWEHAWAGVPIVQPAQISGGDFLVTTANGMGALGMRRISVVQSPSGWKAEERWTSNGLKPYFNDFVVHKGYAYGFDGSILACINLEDGKRAWKGGRYGNGQFVLLQDEDLLLVLSEEGELALVAARPDQFTELAKFKAIEGKTWNHPVVIGDLLLVRNGEEMAAFRLPLARPSTKLGTGSSTELGAAR